MTKSEIFKAAHESAKTHKFIIGDYRVAFVYSLREIYKVLKAKMKLIK